MANGEYISDLQAVDYAFSGVIAGAFEGLGDDGPEAFRRFLKRPVKEKVYFCKNDDVQTVLRKIARHEGEPTKAGPDLPVVVYYRENGLVGDQNQKPVVLEVTRFDGSPVIYGQDNAMRLSTLPLTLTYSLLFLGWDRPTLDRMGLAWFGYIAPIGRKHSRFLVPYLIDGDQLDVPASISAPREILTSSEEAGEGRRLWGSRTMVEINTQALYGQSVQVQDYITLITNVRLVV